MEMHAFAQENHFQFSDSYTVEHHLNFKAVESDKVETAEMQQRHM